MDKEMFLRALKAELSNQQMHQVIKFCQSQKFEVKDYYDYKTLINVCKKRLNNEIDDDCFSSWLIIMCNILNDEKYYNLSWGLDGFSFGESYNEIDIKEIIAFIKDQHIKIHHKNFLKYHIKNKMKVIYLRFEFCDGEDNIQYKCHIVDHENKTYDVRCVDSTMIDYDLNKNYCEIDDYDPMEDNYVCELQHSKIENKLICELYREDYIRDRTLSL